jgi:hypothetical protein
MNHCTRLGYCTYSLVVLETILVLVCFLAANDGALEGLVLGLHQSSGHGRSLPKSKIGNSKLLGQVVVTGVHKLLELVLSIDVGGIDSTGAEQPLCRLVNAKVQRKILRGSVTIVEVRLLCNMLVLHEAAECLRERAVINVIGS